MILYLCADLLWATRVKSSAEDLGISARPVRTLEMLEARLADSDVRGLIVDLEAGPVGIELIGRVAGDAAIPVVAFGPHVAEAALEAAREAGADRVLARGAFANGLGGILRELEAGHPQE
ncbi:hypothetical protein MNBD_PLANCTO03-2128 [hydrothermal vent metagenome]|uniref:Response regulatory domain-containing protein n=1 Tax=hydrothermal vent metagenome TaxID=652676 RepID=A0A3B1DC69_9ZZZZ